MTTITIPVNYIFGRRLKPDACILLPCGEGVHLKEREHIFFDHIFHPSNQKMLVFIWMLLGPNSNQETYFFSLFENGEYIDPEYDERFKQAFNEDFGHNKKGWYYCAFKTIKHIECFLKKMRTKLAASSSPTEARQINK